ncbi:MAG: transketolase family protein [Dethiobacteria bacterium]|jgi:transketolase|nr:transketolase family protein [Bacillota bacterium]
MNEKKIATRDAYGEALVALGKDNADLVVLDADLSQSTKTAKFAAAYPERFFNIGIAEADLFGTAAGLAAAGKLPFASTFAVFATGRAYDQIRNSIAYPRLNVKIAATHAGLTVGEDGASHQALEDIALMRALPGMTVIVPADGREAYRAVFAAAEFDGPVYLRLGRPKVPQITADIPFIIGKGVVLREGDDLSIFSTGTMSSEALKAAQILAEQSLQTEVIHLPTIKPLDQELIVQSAAKTGVAITVEEHNIIGGLGSAVAEVLVEKCPIKMQRLGVRDTFGESGSPAALLEKHGLTAAHIAEAAKALKQ